MKTHKKQYSYMVFQPDQYGVWIRKVTGDASDCRKFLERVKKRFPNAFYKATYRHDFPDPISVAYMKADEDLLKIENYYAPVAEGEK